MNINVLQESKKSLRIEVQDMGHTFCNALVDQLNQEPSVDIAAYTIRHPLIGVPEMIVETDGKVDPRKAISNAIKKLKKLNAKMKQEFQKELK